MKKKILITGAAVLAAAVWGTVQLGIPVMASKEETVGMADHQVHKAALSSKAVAEHELVLLDSRDGSVIQTLQPGTYRNEGAAAQIAYSLAAKYDRPMIPARLSQGNKVEGGRSRIILNSEELAEELRNLKAFKREITVPITETGPNVNAKTAAALGETMIADFTTSFDASKKGRTRNIELSAQAINDLILGPGDRFYYNLVVGERTEARGYQKALEIVNKEFVEGIGGGICQTSSTLYNAVDKAGLEILELHHHSKSVGYVPEKRDATVSYGGYDFKFMNNKKYPVLLKVLVDSEKGKITVQLWSSSKYMAKG